MESSVDSPANRHRCQPPIPVLTHLTSVTGRTARRPTCVTVIGQGSRPRLKDNASGGRCRECIYQCILASRPIHSFFQEISEWAVRHNTTALSFREYTSRFESKSSTCGFCQLRTSSCHLLSLVIAKLTQLLTKLCFT